MDNMTLEQDFDETVVTLTSVFGVVSFLENVLLLVFVLKLLKRLNSNNEQYDFIKQMFFLSVNDTLSSFMLFWLGIIRVTDKETALICAFVDYIPMAVQSMSLSNITCICTFRYCIARNLRKRGAVRQSRFTLVLIVVNCVVGVLSMSSFLATLEIRDIPKGTRMACEYISIVSNQTRMLIGTMFYFTIILFTVVSDIMCLLTIVRLKREMMVVVESSEEGTGTTDSSQINQQANKTRMNAGQRRAICTVLLILVFFNVSILPLVFGLAFAFSSAFKVPDHVLRVLFLWVFVNSMCNPIIIAARIQEIRRMLKQFWEDVKTRSTICCS